MIDESATYSYVEGDAVVIDNYLTAVIAGMDAGALDEFGGKLGMFPIAYCTGGPFGTREWPIIEGAILTTMWEPPMVDGVCWMNDYPDTTIKTPFDIYVGWQTADGTTVSIYKAFNGYLVSWKNLTPIYTDEDGVSSVKIKFSGRGVISRIVRSSIYLEGEVAVGASYLGEAIDAFRDAGFFGDVLRRCWDRRNTGLYEIPYDYSGYWNLASDLAAYCGGVIICQQPDGSILIVNPDNLLAIAWVTRSYDESSTRRVAEYFEENELRTVVNVFGGTDAGTDVYTDGSLVASYGAVPFDYYNALCRTASDVDLIGATLINVAKFKSFLTSVAVVGDASIVLGDVVQYDNGEDSGSFIVTYIKHRVGIEQFSTNIRGYSLT